MELMIVTGDASIGLHKDHAMLCRFLRLDPTQLVILTTVESLGQIITTAIDKTTYRTLLDDPSIEILPREWINDK